MRSTFALAALAGVALAAPHYGGQSDHKNGEQVYWVVETVVETVTVTDNGPAPTYPVSAPYSAAAVTSAVPVYSASAAPVYSATPAYTPAAQPQPQPSSTQAAPAPQSTDTGYMSIVNKYRAEMGLPDLTQSSMLEGNALKTVTDSNGQMVHELNPGSYAQVLAPGTMDDFDHIFCGGWLCEKPSLLPAGTCDTESQGWMYDGTGHADILSSTGYTQIGCACYNGIVGCDLA